MITTRRVLLTTSNQDIIKDIVNFEAIELISSVEERQHIWSLNKTPVIVANEDSKPLPEQVRIPFDTISDTEKFTKWCYTQGFEPGELR